MKLMQLAIPSLLLTASALFAGVANAEERAFTLQVWAPDEVPAIDAKHVEIGEGYYSYL